MKNKIIERIAYHAAMLCVVAFFFVGICALASAAEHFRIVQHHICFRIFRHWQARTETKI